MIQYMTYDMMKDLILHTIGQMGVRPGRTGSPAGADWESAWGGLRTTLLLLMLILGVGTTWGQDLPFVPTTDTNNNNVIDETEKHYYLLQSYGNTGFFMRQNITTTTTSNVVTTLNVLTDDMKWYFLESGDDGYYYICDINNKYLYFAQPSGSTSSRTWMQLKALDDTDKDHYKFSIAKNNTQGWDAFNIIPKGNTGKYCLNKRGRNASADGIQIIDDYNDENSNWIFIPVSSYKWTLRSDCFRVSDSNVKYYYKIKSQSNASYYIKPGTNYVQTSNVNDDDMIWFFEEAGSDELMTYYYIRHANTEKYLHYRSTGVGETNAIDLVDHIGNETGDDEARFQFIVVRGTNNNESLDAPGGIIFNIVPILLKSTSSDVSIKSVSCDGGQGKALKTKSDRMANTTHWSFVPATFTGAWADPEITCDATGTVTITCSEDDTDIYYTTNGDIPTATETETNFKYDANSKPTVTTGKTTIKARVIKTGKKNSNVVTKTIVLNPTITLTAESYTYDGTAQVPVGSVDYVDSENSGNNIHFETSQYAISYKKGDDAVPECKNAGIYTIVLNDADGDEYFIYGTGSFTIDQKALTVTAKPKTITYGEVPSNDGVTYEGFAGTEDETVLGGEFAYAYNYSQYGDAGSYTITPSGLTSTNYNITFEDGTLTVNPKEVGLTWSTPTSFTYDGAAHALTATATGTENGDAIEVTVTTTAKEGSSLTEGNAINAGTYTATISELTGNKAGNYTLPTTPAQDFTISKKSATVSGITVSDKTYDGTTTATINRDEEVIDGILPGDDVSITDVTGTFADANADINSKAVNVVITTDGTSVGNYELSVPGGLTAKINRRLLKITANDNTISYGAAAVDNDVNYDSFAIGDDESLLEGTLTYSFNTLVDGTGDPYTTTSPKGSSFYIIPDGLHLPDGNNNYTITFAVGTLTVEAKSIEDETNLASGFDVALDTDGNIKLYDGTSELTSNDYEETGTPTTSESGRYVTRTIQGKGNYTGSAKVREAIVNLANDGGTGAYYGTFVAECTDPEVGHALPEGITAYIIKSSDINGRVVTPTALTYIPKDVPVLLMSATNKDGFLVKSGTGTDDTTGNLLKEVTSSTPNFIDDVNSDYNQKAYFNVANIYLLYKNEFVLNKAGYLAKGKVYMEKPSGGSGARLKISKGDGTGIENIEYTIDSQSEGWYTLDGRRLSSKPTKKGLYLQSGKKIVVK